ncbi:unnamed protein product [Macrosiphum euphorbiae]|uniref:MULE transposase domain-containing protein n=1 Tax=Macrosiphum euphorbiae TaxID=13131 RepID=A0AAV0WZW3_9HEMI|nr:unnamed protein product [Macrosiphum euphorbiae]
MEKVIREIGGSRGVGLKFKDEDGYTYWKNRQCRLHFTVRCASWRAGCRAKGRVLNNDKTKVILIICHETHPEDQLALHNFKNICNQRAQTENIPLRVIYNETCTSAEFINVHVGAFVSHRRTMRRHRRQTQPVSPRSMTEFHGQLSGDYTHLTKLDNATLYNGLIGNTPQEGVILLFILPEVINILRTGTTFLFDGTFASAPSFGNECQQLYVIMGITFNTGFPIGFALMSRKTECAYSALFNKILTLVPEWKPQTIIIDFERAAIASIKSIFPNTVIRGCWFHSSQAVWRIVGNIGKLLYSLYLSDEYSSIRVLSIRMSTQKL